MSPLLDREAIVELLRQLGERLHARGITAEIYIVGGSAMILAYNRTRLTRDIDAVSEPQEEVEREARLMAAGRRDLPPDWFNGKVRALLPRVLDTDALESISAAGPPRGLRGRAATWTPRPGGITGARWGADGPSRTAYRQVVVATVMPSRPDSLTW